MMFIKFQFFFEPFHRRLSVLPLLRCAINHFVIIGMYSKKKDTHKKEKICSCLRRRRPHINIFQGIDVKIKLIVLDIFAVLSERHDTTIYIYGGVEFEEHIELSRKWKWWILSSSSSSEFCALYCLLWIRGWIIKDLRANINS